MWYLVVLFVGIISIAISICEVESRLIRNLDVATVLNVLKEQRHQNGYDYHHKNEHSLEDKSRDYAADNEDNIHFGSLKSREIVDLIEQATHNKNVNDISSDYKELINKKNHVTHKIHGVKDIDERMNQLKPQSKLPLDESVGKQILLYIQSKGKPKKKLRKEAVKNQKQVSNIVHSIPTQGREKHNRADVIDDYSKIYVIFNPLAILKSSNKNSLSEIISKISSLPSTFFTKESAEVNKDQRYKGFFVKEDVSSRRARRDSKEKYDLKDSMEDYKQKRARNDHGSGRTAIPYIRHRGDIYERDN